MASGARLWRGVIEEYRSLLPLAETTPTITLGEGGTPLVESPWLSQLTQCTVWVKVEGSNPTGSFKDRGMTVAVSRAVEDGIKLVACASTGNTSASAAAYAVRGGMVPLVLVPEGRIAKGKLAQAIVFGARLVEVQGNFDACLTLARGLCDSYPVVLVNSANQDGHRLAGQKTAAYEIVDALGDAPDIHVLPVGNAGNITAYWAGYGDYARRGTATRRPRMWGFQAAGAAPIVHGAVVQEPETVATAIRVGNPARWREAVAARDESAGRIDQVSDEQILRAQANLAARDGIFVEPASAAGVAGLLQSHQAGLVDPGQTIVMTVTGHGLKDVDTALTSAGAQPGATEVGTPGSGLDRLVVPPDPDATARALQLD